MTDPADLAHAVLLKVADFVRKLPAGQLRDLADGTAKLELVPRGGRAPVQPRRPVEPTVDAARIRADLAGFGDMAAARQYLLDLKLTVAKLQALAKDLGISVPSRPKKDQLVQAIVQWTVGRRLDSESISRPAPAYG